MFFREPVGRKALDDFWPKGGVERIEANIDFRVRFTVSLYPVALPHPITPSCWVAGNTGRLIIDAKKPTVPLFFFCVFLSVFLVRLSLVWQVAAL